MKKGIIVEHYKRYTIVMDKDGLFHKASPVKEKEIGMETYFQPEEKRWFHSLFSDHKSQWKIATMILICLLFLSPLYIWLAEEKAYAVVHIDINPSFDVMIDADYRVLKIEGINEDAKKIVESLEVKGHKLTTLTDEIIEFADDDRGNRERPLLMAVSYFQDQNDDQQFEEDINNYYQELGYEVAIYQVPEELRNQADNEHVSMNQLTAQQIRNKNDSEKMNSSSDDISPSSSLDDEEKELINNYYNSSEEDEKNEKEEKSMEEQDQDNSESNLERSTRKANKHKQLTNQQKVSKKEVESVNIDTKNKNHGQQVKQQAKIKNENNHGIKVSKEAKNKSNNNMRPKITEKKTNKIEKQQKRNPSSEKKANRPANQKGHPGKGQAIK